MKIRTSSLGLTTLTAAVLAFSLALSGAARADDPGQDEVTLKNGGSIRGTIVSSEPGTSVKIVEVGQTQPRVIPWSQVSDVEKGKYAPKSAEPQPGPAGPGYGAPPPGAQQQDAEPQPRLGDPGVVRLHIDSPQPAAVIEHRYALIGRVGNYGLVLHAERRVCVSPCDTVIDGSEGSIFRLADDNYPSGGSWSLAGMSGDVTLKVEPGNTAKRTGGALALVFGALAAGAGAVLFPLGQTASVTDLSTNRTVNVPNKGLRNAGLGLLVPGAAVLGVGIALFVTGSTKLTFTQGTAAPAGKTAARKPRYWMGEF